MADTSRRTGVSGLTDAELELLDIVAIQCGSRGSFRVGVFSGQYNRPCHGLDDLALKATLDRFEKKGWTTGKGYASPWSASDRSVEMTPTGGQLWESERLPDWTRHVMDEGDGSCRPGSERHRASIFGYSPVIVRAFFDAGCACGFFDFAGGPIRTGVARRRWVYWRPLQPVYRLSAWVESWSRHTDWERMETMRCWWRFPDEIGKLWGLPPA
jgi:hypothetical protein